MAIDLRKDFKTLSKHVKERVNEYSIYENLGPGDDADPVSLITFGFEFDQSCWVALVFDTRPDAHPDGAWTGCIESVDFDHWLDRPGPVTMNDGSKAQIPSDFDEAQVAKYFGDLLHEVLISSRDAGVFKKLPVTEDCKLFVEHQCGHYAAIDYLDGRIQEEDFTAKLLARIERLPLAERVEYWIAQLSDNARGIPCDIYMDGDSEEKIQQWDVFEVLGASGSLAVTPLLELCLKLAKLPVPKTPELIDIRDTVVQEALEIAEKYGVADHATKRLVVDILLASIVECEKNKIFWTCIPDLAARFLHEQFGSPSPKCCPDTNAVENTQAILRALK